MFGVDFFVVAGLRADKSQFIPFEWWCLENSSFLSSRSFGEFIDGTIHNLTHKCKFLMMISLTEGGELVLLLTELPAKISHLRRLSRIEQNPFGYLGIYFLFSSLSLFVRVSCAIEFTSTKWIHCSLEIWNWFDRFVIFIRKIKWADSHNKDGHQKLMWLLVVVLAKKKNERRRIQRKITFRIVIEHLCCFQNHIETDRVFVRITQRLAVNFFLILIRFPLCTQFTL